MTDSIINKKKPYKTPDLEPKWNVFKPFGALAENAVFIKYITLTKDKLSSTSKLLNKTIELIDSARGVLKLVSIFESIFKNLLYTFLNTLLDQLQTMVNDAKSTGIYALDLVSYHWVKTADTENIKDITYLAKIAEGPWFDTDTATTDNKMQIKPPQTGVFTKIGEFLKAVDQSYKRETYSQFIETIVDALEDTKDIPSGATAYLHSNFNDSSFYKTIGSYDENDNIVQTKQLKSEVTDMTPKVLGLQPPNFFQSGRPDFGQEAYMRVFLIAYCMPDLGNVVRLLQTMYNFVGDLIPMKDMLDILDKIIDEDTYIDGVNQIIKDVKETPEKISKVFNEVSDYFSDEVDKAAEEFNKIYGVVTVPAKEPNFYGVNMYTLFAPYFDYLQNMLNICRSWANKELPGVGGLVETLNNWLDDLEEQIRRLLTLIEMIENFIRLLEMILNITGLRILSFETKDGLPGVVNALRNSKGFGEENEEQNAINEKQRAKIAKKNISELKTAFNNNEAILSDLYIRQNNLNNLNHIVKEWNTYIITQGLKAKQDAYIVSEDHYDNDIQTQQSLIDAITDSHEDLLGLIYKKSVLLDDYNLAIYGNEDIDGINQKITDSTEERDQLIADHSNPLLPDIEDYEDKLNELNIQIDTFNTLKTETANTYNYTNNNYTWVQTTINNSSDSYATQLINAGITFQNLKNDNNPDHSGSQAEIYHNNDTAFDNTIADLNQDIEDLYAENIVVNDLKNTKRDAIYSYNSYTYLIKAEDYTPATMPPDTDPAPWNITEFRDLFLNSSNGYFWCVNRLAAIPTDIENKFTAITAAEEDKQDNLDIWDNFSDNNIMMQERYKIMQSVLVNEINKADYNTEKNAIITAKNSDLNTKNTEINNIINNAWNNYLKDSLIYYKETVPYTQDGKVIGNWTNNEIGYLIWKDKYNLKNPEIVNNLCPAIENAVLFVNNEINIANQNVIVSKSAYEEAIKKENKRLETKADKKASSWSKTQKYYYGGFLFTYGWPLNITNRMSKDISALYRDNFTDPLQKESATLKSVVSDEEAGKKMGQFLNWVFK